MSRGVGAERLRPAVGVGLGRWVDRQRLDPQHLHLLEQCLREHPPTRLDFWVTVEIHERDGRDMATTDLGEDSQDVGVGDTPQEAVPAALRGLGEP